ncbi:hypothetical protein HN51_070843 [Arachis hypogaea]|uniref:Uncharacterized protein n=1 Tax=Arachis hypogaea TaxID=3818 RepID=A0A444Z0G4_ARAHY|nr:transcription factor MYB62-like [Arachis ipaensis]XP_025650976.1 transcription factor MYB62-like [Arachis hypogaea]QHO13289.1 uncharacterized protein DS421_15g514220 [Arachis hypogaea]RYR07682.1 hypothetical protein Ahy_B05g075090 [Arachis hypogaea]
MSFSSKSNNKNIISCSSEDDNNNKDNELRRGPWTHEEDDLLKMCIAIHGEGRWNFLAKSSGLKRTGKSCRLRWLNYLKPDVKRGNLTPQEKLLIFELHSKWGNRWSKIAQQLPGRTDNEIKNFWRTRIQKQVKYFKIDTLWRTRFVDESKELYQEQNQNQALIIPTMSPDCVTQMQQYPSLIEEATPTPAKTQIIPCERPSCMMNGASSNCVDYSDYENNNNNNGSSCMSFTESTNMANMVQFETLDNITNAYGMDALNIDMECQVSQSNWLDKDFVCTMWNMNMDELSHFRSIQNQ